jgi:hypothetical protein
MTSRPKDAFGFPQVTAIPFDDVGKDLAAFWIKRSWSIWPMIEFRHVGQFRPEMVVG